MAGKKKATKKQAKKTAAPKGASKKAPAKAAAKSGARASAKKAPAKKAPAAKAPAKKAPAAKAPAKKAPPAKSAPAKVKGSAATAAKKAPKTAAPAKASSVNAGKLAAKTAKKLPPKPSTEARAKKSPPSPALVEARGAKNEPPAATGKGKKKVAAAAPPLALPPEKPRPVNDDLEAGSDEAGGVAEGQSAPSFELPDQSGASVSSASLAGAPYVLYFYPKDDTPGCTREACDFRDNFGRFGESGIKILGVSPDSVQSHGRFEKKYGLPFTLLSDTEKSLISAYGVWVKKKNYGREYMGVERSTFLVDGEGVVRKAWRGVSVNGHVAEILQAAESVS